MFKSQRYLNLKKYKNEAKLVEKGLKIYKIIFVKLF